MARFVYAVSVEFGLSVHTGEGAASCSEKNAIIDSVSQYLKKGVSYCA